MKTIQKFKVTSQMESCDRCLHTIGSQEVKVQAKISLYTNIETKDLEHGLDGHCRRFTNSNFRENWYRFFTWELERKTIAI